MLTTLKARVHGDRIEWLEASEEAFPPAQTVEALITPLQPLEPPAGPSERAERRVAALRRLASLNAFQSIANPEQWQRERRIDRDLPGRS